eukprot:CAMPEP_0114377936 /NCGR_PEP_ID=MMETSP0102-20121206/1318_1 /TAXON_ID=38822 ORGANISM="Pteridomonas danica, Strain PT" /NCGR_SAMPLE_ID=MMETSP0102 /ASSEMBLY_ACC=CAM_ASM_000212 /LENGTH=896 /DNA_ID=CAMNT_0001532657 /DNA_START=97 /DNA_END=2783 /DNA_ORIENTATION=-
MNDAYGDGWGAVYLVITSCDDETLLSTRSVNGYSTHTQFCVPDGGEAFWYSCLCTDTPCSYLSDVSWTIDDANGIEVVSGDGNVPVTEYGDCGTKTPTMVPTPCESVSSVVMFYVEDYLSNTAADNTYTVLDSLCTSITTITSWTSGDLSSHLSGQSIFIIPELSGSTDWTTVLSAADISTLYSFVSDGGSLIIMGDNPSKSYDVSLLNEVFGYNLTHASNDDCARNATVDVIDSWSYRTVFASDAAPTSLEYASLVQCLEASSLPTTAVSVYGTDDHSWVTWMPLNSGAINFIAWDYSTIDDAETAGTLDDWVKVMQLSMTSQQTEEPTSFPTAVPTILPSHSRPPTQEPTHIPTPLPTYTPTPFPTHVPTPLPTIRPSFVPTSLPSARPTNLPTMVPLPNPTNVPIPSPSPQPSPIPSPQPSPIPSLVPTQPTFKPTPTPTHPPTISPTKHDQVSTVVAMTINAASESDLTYSVIANTLGSVLSSLGVSSSNILDFEYTSWTDSRRLENHVVEEEMTTDKAQRLLSGVASISANVVIELSETSYTSAASLETAISDTIDTAETDGSFVSTLSSDCGCSISSVSTVVSLSRSNYPTFYPTPLPTLTPTICAVKPYTILTPSGSESYVTGDTIPISWEYRPCTSQFVDIYICTYVSGGGSKCYGGGVNDTYTNIGNDGFEPNTGNFSLIVEQDLPSASGIAYFIKVADDVDADVFAVSSDFTYSTSPSSLPTSQPTPWSTSADAHTNNASSNELLIVGAGAAAGFLLLAIVGGFMIRACRGNKGDRGRGDTWTDTANDVLNSDPNSNAAIEIRRMDEADVPETAIAVAGEWVEEGADSEVPVAALVSEMDDEELSRVAYGNDNKYTKKEKADAVRRLSRTGSGKGSFGSVLTNKFS